jgi:predicted metal-dependent enzyme (double-stranded beta helix superfamily)
LTAVTQARIEPAVVHSTDVWRDPVTVEPALKILPTTKITMTEMAEGTATVAANLTTECQILYDNVAGDGFVLDAPDFPNFSEAIEASIKNPDGWCYQTLKAKADEFGKPNPDETYLRITLGVNQGESPGIPFVMEIWPHGHFSPIHDHGGANAVIKILHGEICVSLYPMLSPHHETPFAEASFVRDDVVWITPRLNQVHMLKNHKTPPCVTIQCYLYPETNDTHWPYFDYLGSAGEQQFVPNSDMDFLAFKARMKEEWEGR